MSESKYWIWGQLDKKSMDFLNSVYSIINQEFNGPYFDIHITLAGPIKTFDEKLLKNSYHLKISLIRLDLIVINILFQKIFTNHFSFQ